ncbi:MAG: RNA 3'-terminal phosphate cyclase [Chloroflexota bacterium]
MTLLFQALLMPLALAAGPSRLTLRGGTHTRWSPPYHYLAEVYLPALRPVGVRAELALPQWGWYPRGGGEMTAEITPVAGGRAGLRAVEILDRGELLGVRGLSASSHLPAHVMKRQRDQAAQRLWSRHIKAEIALCDAPSPGPGSVMFLLARYESVNAGFTGYGRLRYPAEKVADDAFEAFDAHRMSRAALEPHLADQLVLPLALAPGRSAYTTSEVSAHLTTVCWVVAQFLGRDVRVEGEAGQPGTVTVGA